MPGNHDSNGRFVKGNTASSDLAIPDDIRRKLKTHRQDLIRIFDQYGHLTLDEIKERTKFKNALTPIQITILKFWEKISTTADPALLKMMFHLYGIPIDVKAVQITENVLGSPSPESSDEEEGPMQMTTAQKRKALQIALDGLEDDEAG